MDLNKPNDNNPQDEEIAVFVGYGGNQVNLHMTATITDPEYVSQALIVMGLSYAIGNKLDIGRLTSFLNNWFGDETMNQMKRGFYVNSIKGTKRRKRVRKSRK